MDYNQTIDYLFNRFASFQQVGGAAYKPGLDNITRFCKSLDNPQRNYLTVHIAGTNGKGSVAHILASVLTSAGYRVGLYTSPHLNDFRERIKIDGEMISRKYVTRFVDQHRQRMEELDLSFFEITTAMAFQYFSDQNVEIAVIETGLGGRLDATNIIKPILSVITNIGLEHTEYLGDTIEKIAAEKAGIIKREVPVVVGQTDPECAHVFLERAQEMDAKIIFADNMHHIVNDEVVGTRRKFTLERVGDGKLYNFELDLLGEYERHNMLTTLAAVWALRHDTSVSISTRAFICGCRDAAASTGLRGRWQQIAVSPLTICDTGHNGHGLAEVVLQMQQQKCDKLYIVFGVVREKDLTQILPLMPKKAYYIFTRSANARALDAQQLAEHAASYDLKGEVSPSVAEAVQRARVLAGADDMIFITGSTFVVAEALESEAAQK